MQSTLLRLAVALLAFGVGVSTTMLWIAYTTPVAKRRANVPCPLQRSPQMSAPPLAELPPPPPPPAPPFVPVSGGVLNGKAISLPQPAYPPLAKAARGAGTVQVQVTVDKSGRVVSSEAVSGHPLLREAAARAARGARFSPTLVSGQPVTVTGVLVYNFVLQ
ncbi:MAG TPA: TonB family protein [Pyrinomonadaceae bacterium]|nr:TonB family protein [Pyrinomonadaceae bacterium]